MQTQNGAHSYSPKAFITRQRALTILLTLLVGTSLLLAFIWTKPLPHYILVLDSGSTGTRIYAYRWKERPNQLPLIESIDISAASHKVPRRQGGKTRAFSRVETEPGLSEYLEDLPGIKENCLRPLLEWAEEVVPFQRQKETPIFLFGTAGLRSLAEFDQEQILLIVRDVLHSSPFRFSNDWAQVLTGEKEGIYGWIALNYLLGYLSPHPFIASRSRSLGTDSEGALESLSDGKTVSAASQDLKTVGALDLGGSSLEVTFMPMKISEETVTANVSVLGVQYSLFTQTHSSHGLNSAFEKSVQILLNVPDALRDEDNRVWGSNHAGLKASKSRTSGNLDYAAGLQIAASKQNLGKQATVLNVKKKRTRDLRENLRESSSRMLKAKDRELDELSHPCLHQGYKKEYSFAKGKSGRSTQSIVLIGQPDWKACDRLANLVIDGSQNCEKPPCALGTSQPLTSQPMFALTGFYVVYHFFGLPLTATLEELEKKGRRFCDTDWDAISSNRGIEVHVEHYCFRSLYVIKLLRQGLGLPEAQIQMGTGQEDWTLGAALSEGGKIGAGFEISEPAIPRIPFFTFLALTWILWSIFALYHIFMGRNLGRGIERKPSGHASSPLPSLGSGRQTNSGLPPLPRNLSSQSLQGGKLLYPNSPTAVIGGGDYNTNVARLSLSTERRKRSSVEDLTSLR